MKHFKLKKKKEESESVQGSRVWIVGVDFSKGKNSTILSVDEKSSFNWVSLFPIKNTKRVNVFNLLIYLLFFF